MKTAPTTDPPQGSTIVVHVQFSATVSSARLCLFHAKKWSLANEEPSIVTAAAGSSDNGGTDFTPDSHASVAKAGSVTLIAKTLKL